MRILRMPELRQTIGLSRSTVYDMIRAGRFPAPVKLGERAVGWREDAVQRWLEERSAERSQLWEEL